MTDLQAKYQKLATEYSKLRAQVPVLKKAVLDELAKQDELKETIKERDQAMRQYEQETDSLMFRNRQLSTRVSLLQEELDRSDFKHSKHKHDKRNAVVHEPELSAGDSVLGEELKSKIEENARLHRQVFESVERHQQSENELQERVRRLSEEVSKQKQLFSVSEQEHKEHLNKLQSQKAKMELTERVVLNRLVDHVSLNNLQEKFQSAYEPNHSTETALMLIQNDILMTLDNKWGVLLFLLDLTAAFDTVDHTLLLACMRSVGVIGVAHKFESYLTSRTQTVCLGQTQSDPSELLQGVPQGSVLGPVLFTLYTGPIGQIVRRHRLDFHLFADDSQLYVSFKIKDTSDEMAALARIQACIGELKAWMTHHRLQLNDDKTEVLVITTPSSASKHSLTDVVIGDSILQPTAVARNIGVMFDSELSMKSQVSKLCQVAYFHLHRIRSIRDCLTQHATELLVHSLVISPLDYGNGLLYGVPDQLLDKLQRVQNVAARIVVRASRIHLRDSPLASCPVQLQQQEKHLKEAQLKVNSLEAQLRSLPSSEPSRLQTNNSISVQETVFSDMKKQDNVVAGDVSWQQSREVTFEMETLIAALIHQLSNLYTYSKQRCTVHPPEIDCQPLGDVTTMDTANSLEEFALTLKSFVNHVTTLLPCQLLSIDDECRMSTCTESLETKNRQLQTSLKNFTSCLSNLETYISLLTAKSGTHGNQTTLSVDKLFEMLMQAGADFHNATTDLSKQFSIKVSLERQLPTATQKWKQTDDHITSTLEDLATCSSQLAAFLKDNLSLLCKVQSEVNLSVMSKPGGESGGDVIQNGQASVISTQCTDSLTLQVATLQERLCELEQDKEKWMLEMELQQMKYEKLQQKTLQLEETLQKMETQLSGDAMATTMTTSQSPMSTNEASTNRCPVSTSWLGKLKIESSEEESETREELIKHYFSRRMAEVTSKLQTADSRALHFHTECGVLHNRLRLTLKDREKLQEELSMAKELVIQVKDELQTMTDGYKSQLSTMSEHLAGMNEKLTAQKDEIDMLKYQLHNVMTGKKGRGK
ncbi:Protein phosphatase 1 regulatory subunit 21 [Lamellibrachia satsuma]|nr:Protein phosphatase 1 regulatory subunit 21 [Lamellibrachia satsuma]